MLDAGCGTGRHAQGLATYGHRVALLDASTRLLEIARRRCPDADSWQADLCSPAIDTTFDAVMSRGVLNDLVLDEERDAAFGAFAALCDRGGLLFLDVREAAASALRADGRTRRITASLGDGKSLVFTSVGGGAHPRRRGLRAHRPGRALDVPRVHVRDAPVDTSRAHGPPHRTWLRPRRNRCRGRPED
ncbi:class I SAM-dependent methyltransferase [Nocardioides ungokensis]